MGSLAGGITSWNEVLLYYPAIFYLDKWTLGDSAPHFMCERLIKQNSDTLNNSSASFFSRGGGKNPEQMRAIHTINTVRIY